MTPKMTRWSVALAAGLMLTGLAQAQTKKDLAAKVVQLQQIYYSRIGQQLAGNTAQSLLQQAGAAISQLPADKREAVAKDVQADVKKFYDSTSATLTDKAGKIALANVPAELESKFSEEELKQIIAFLESPVSKKFDDTMGSTMGMVTDKLLTDSRSVMEPKIKALQESIQKRLSAAASTPAASAAKPAKPAKK